MAWNLFDFSFILFTMMSLEFGRIRLPAACSSVVVKKMYKKTTVIVWRDVGRELTLECFPLSYPRRTSAATFESRPDH